MWFPLMLSSSWVIFHRGVAQHLTRGKKKQKKNGPHLAPKRMTKKWIYFKAPCEPVAIPTTGFDFNDNYPLYFLTMGSGNGALMLPVALASRSDLQKKLKSQKMKQKSLLLQCFLIKLKRGRDLRARSVFGGGDRRITLCSPAGVCGQILCCTSQQENACWELQQGCNRFSLEIHPPVYSFLHVSHR